MNRIALTIAMAVLLCSSMFAQTTYSFQDINYPGDTFTQLLGINDNNVIAGYHGANINQGFTLVLPNNFTSENYPNSVQTQVTGINNAGETVGFYIDKSGNNHGFKDVSGAFTTVDFPGEPFNQLLGISNSGQLVGYFSTTASGNSPDYPTFYEQSSAPTVSGALVINGGTTAQATGINNSGLISGFVVDSAGVNHGFLLTRQLCEILDYPQATGTMALGLNNKGSVVGTYTDQAGNSHGFVYNISSKSFTSVDDPNGIGTTIVNGINDHGVLVGFWGTSPNNTGFVATPQQ